MKRYSVFAMALLLLLAVFTPAAAIKPVLPRHPSLNPDGSLMAFDWRGDIWIVPAEGGAALRVTAHVAHDAYPYWSPDGKEIAFSSDRYGNTDIFVVGTQGGSPERLTFHSDEDQIYGWSPDGGTVYFGSRRESRQNLIYAVSRTGGRPLRITGDLAFNSSVSPDGRWLAYVRGYTNWWRKHYRGSANRDIWIRPMGGGESFQITSWDGDDDQPKWAAGGRTLYFQSEREDGVMNLYRLDLAVDGENISPSGEPVQITHITEDGIQYLNLSQDGHWAVFECNGGLYRVSTAGGEPLEVPIDCPGDLKENPVERRILTSGASEFAFAPGEKQIAFVAEGEIYAALINENELREPIRLTETDAREKDLAWLDENTLIFTSDRFGDDDLFLLRSTDKEEKRLGKSRYREEIRLTDSPETERAPQVSPDSKTILYRRGTGFLWTMDGEGRHQKLLVDEPQVLHSSWSPDSRYVAYSYTTLGHAEDINIVSLETLETHNVSNHPNDDFHPLWTGDGKRLSWASRTDDGFYSIRYLWLTTEEADKSSAEREREEEQEESLKKDRKDGGASDDDEDKNKEKDKKIPEVKIDWSDFPDRIRTVTTVRGYYWDYDQSPDGKHYALKTDAVEGMELWTVDWDGDNLRRLTHNRSDPDKMTWNEASDKVRYLSRGQIREIENKEGAEESTYTFSVDLTVDARARRLQKFSEAWRLLNDGFYDPNFHGVVWPAMREKYLPLAAEALMREDFNDVVREMIGELNASHLGIYGPRDSGGDETGLLGFTPDDSYDGPGIKVAAVLKRGPLDREGRRVHPEDIILSINGREIEPGQNYYPLLNHMAGKEVDLAISPMGKGGKKKTMTVEPLDAGRYWTLSYSQWMDSNRQMVDQLSEGKIGYLHMSAMGDDNWDRFLEDIFSRALGKEGLILDVRFNNGGSIHDRVLTFLSRRAYCYSKGRGDRNITYDALQRWEKPIVLLTNERSYSDGEIFPWGFKALGLGLVVGMPTFGAVIGTNDVRLIDGTGFRVPGTGWYRMNGESLENNAVQPDIRVPDVPEENLQNRDAQLERGVQECLRMIQF
ncbi:MAG: PDZ domain-containing protein [Candidatus Eisenbacteria bacterium]|uniref:Tricorn protease homolog n=1 Tax=Eiseniibacteriota bacterium TaxID=2212470 RepID=A0A948RYW7_UNCEI|nr:PDZ domain-containing protein [Candidatus Eisenbacteria bacterium]MBU1947857.1 PDZ domain-containing protein [Candidatus Eisenbacteria bacterium]MBU2690784.1 PDZ domain-containing protein [Candidatus Eisenbacteria bacterium]